MEKLSLPGHVHVAATADALFDDLGHALLGAAEEAVRERGVFHLALSGGSTPEPFYVRLVTDPQFRMLPWKQTHLWMVDERRVPETDERSNFRMIRETLADHVPTPRRQVHPMPVLHEEAAREYERTMSAAFGLAMPAGDQPLDPAGPLVPRLDFVLLGMGDDAHTASLFPGSAATTVVHRWITANDGPGVTPPPRLTMTFPLLNGARSLAVLVVGAKKHATLRRVELQLKTGGASPSLLPITSIDPVRGELVWYLDAAAARGAST
ncbi:MAG: 6-phosphogluconolactonase [Planctomycetes bacterium]|nr:6-phosphogluconolactonase [Planctomycetota bacterium]